MNNANLIGRLTKDPELSYTTQGKAVCKFTLAVDRPTRDEQADFIHIVVWDKKGENCNRYLHKGSKCAVSGRIQTGSYKGQDGKTVYTTDVVASNVDFLDPKPVERPAPPQAEDTFNPADDTYMPF